VARTVPVPIAGFHQRRSPTPRRANRIENATTAHNPKPASSSGATVLLRNRLYGYLRPT
jgi:hypothetical protein